jgi:hypothetical protein
MTVADQRILLSVAGARAAVQRRGAEHLRRPGRCAGAPSPCVCCCVSPAFTGLFKHSCRCIARAGQGHPIVHEQAALDRQRAAGNRSSPAHTARRAGSPGPSRRGRGLELGAASRTVAFINTLDFVPRNCYKVTFVMRSAGPQGAGAPAAGAGAEARGRSGAAARLALQAGGRREARRGQRLAPPPSLVLSGHATSLTPY